MSGTWRSMRRMLNAGCTMRRRRSWSSPSLTIRAVSPSTTITGLVTSRHVKRSMSTNSGRWAAGPIEELGIEERPDGAALALGLDAQGEDTHTARPLDPAKERPPSGREEPAAADAAHGFVGVRKHEGDAHGLAILLGEESQVGVEDLLEVLRQVLDLGLGHRREAPVAGPRRVVHLEEAVDLGVEVVHAHGAQLDVAASLDSLESSPLPVGEGRRPLVDRPAPEIHRRLPTRVDP